jgi:membrane associated rhomboid family serine protease
MYQSSILQSHQPGGWVKILLLANAAVFLGQLAFPGGLLFLAFSGTAALAAPWTAFTYMFLHAGVFHIAGNMIGLYVLGPRLEQYLGRLFPALFVTSGAGGAALTMLLQPDIVMVGASGGVMGLLLASATVWPSAQISPLGLVSLKMSTLVVILAAFSLTAGFAMPGDGVAHFGHLGGMVSAWLFMKLAARRVGRSAAHAAARRLPAKDHASRFSRLK